ELANSQATDKVPQVLAIMKACGADEWAVALKQQYFDRAMQHLDEVAVVSGRKEVLTELAHFLVQRDY
nr:polyprenyl synthetase family protein [Chitinophagaceae bacterium]